MAMGFEPFPHLGFFMIGGVVLDQINPVAFLVIARQQDLLQKRDVSEGVEILGLMTPKKPPGGNADRTPYFLRVPLPARRNLRLATFARPSSCQRGSLAERRLILVNDHRFLGAGFFFRLGYW